MNKSVGGPQSSSGSFGVRKYILSLPGIKPHFLGPAHVKYADNLAEGEMILEDTIYRLTEVGNNCGKIKVMRISVQPFAVQIIIGQK
jgi:hypothetical protein